MIRRIAKIIIGEYVDLLGIMIIVIGSACLTLSVVLAYLRINPFAIAFFALGAVLVLLGYLGTKLIDALVVRLLR